VISRRGFRILLVSGLVLLSAGAGVFTMRVPFSYDLATDDGLARWHTRPAWVAGWLTRLGEVVLPLLERGDTEYARGFTERAFSEVEPGASQGAVRQSLGAPLLTKAFPDGTTVWYYSRHGPRSRSYFIRALEFSSDNKVSRIFREYYLD